MHARQFTLSAAVLGNACLHAERAALIDDDRTISHRELEHRTNRLARVLMSRGVAKGDRIALLLNDSAQFIELLIAAGKAGAIAVLLNWRLSPHEIARILDDAGPKLVLRADRFAPLVATASVSAELVVADDAAAVARYEGWAGGGPDGALELGIGQDDPLFMMFTSGTTGRPKGCIHTHGSTLAHTMSFALRRGFTASDNNLSTNPLFHVAGLGHALSTLVAGGANVFVPRDAGPLAPIELSLRHGCTLALLSKPLLEARRLADEETRRSLRFRSITAGAGMADPAGVAFVAEEWGALVSGGWGQTEACGFATMIDYPDMLAHPKSIGWPIPPIEAAVLDAHGRPLDDPEAEGELGIRSANVMLGYWNNPEATEAALGTGWLRTGDMAVGSPDGLFTVRGRLKELIKSGGENVYPVEVEAVLKDLPGVADCAVAGVRDRKWGEAVKAFVVLAPGARFSAEVMTARCRERIAGYKRPRYLEFVEEIPRDHLGKIRRFELSARPVEPDQAVA